MRILLISMMLLWCGIGQADELRHLIHDIDVYGTDNWEDTRCIDGTHNHLFINLSYEDCLKIQGGVGGANKDYFQADFCIKCRLIPVRCSGNDWFRYIVNEAKEAHR